MAQTILVIDDELAVRRLICEILQFGGYEVESASNGREGVEIASTVKPDLILCDVSMPEMNGFDTLKTIREGDETALIPFIFLTGRSHHDDMRKGMASGADDYLTKPFHAQELIKAVRARLDRQEEVRKFSEQKLKELRGNIVHMLPHELRTPLQGILGFADILREEYQTMDAEQVGELSNHIHVAAKRLHRLIENFLIYAQIEVTASNADQVANLRSHSTHFGEGSVNDLFVEHEASTERQNDLKVWVQEDQLAISDSDLSKIIFEIIDNSFKFSEAGNLIQINGWLEDDAYVLTVEDCGRGMTPEEIENIGAYSQFQRKFYEQQGSGMGLVIAKRLVELHGGTLTINSVPEEGTTVEVRLPRAIVSCPK